MNSTKNTFVTAFALFSLFFGAGNLILPPYLGLLSGNLWWLVTLGFCASAICIPILGIFAHAKLQGTLLDFGKHVSPTFGLLYAYIIYAISISLPAPRTASVTHEIAIAPFVDSPYLLTSTIYFGLVFVFAINRNKILNIIGKFLTPAILMALCLIISITFWESDFTFSSTTYTTPFTAAVIEGYQTFDAIGAVVIGGVIIVSINLGNYGSYTEKRVLLRKAAAIAGGALILIYTGLILTGALVHDSFDGEISRTALLNGISQLTLGKTGNVFMSILVSLACFTTAVGIVTGTADFISSRYQDSKKVFRITALIGCLLGVAMGQFNVAYIIAVALPVLMFIYPITIILIVLNVVPDSWIAPNTFKTVVLITGLFCLPDFLGTIPFLADTATYFSWIPLSSYHMGWVLPAIITFIICYFLKRTTIKNAH